MRLRSSICCAVMLISAVTSYGRNHLGASLIVVGPGDPVYYYWGHIGIAVENRDTGENLFYDFGNFSFYSENFYRDFAMGRMRYLGFVTPTDAFLQRSLGENRDLAVYPLDLGPEELEELDRTLRWWVLPENREYLYDYFLNNCSTILRDILNDVTDNQLKRATEDTRDLNFRHYARTGAHQSRIMEIVLHFTLGSRNDKPISAWDLMFLPEAMGRILLDFTYTGRDGVQRTLAREKTVLQISSRTPVPEKPRAIWHIMFAAGLASAALWAFSSEWKRGGFIRVPIILIAGLPGLAVGFFTLFTDHVSGHANINLWPAFPALLTALLPLGMQRWWRREEIMDMAVILPSAMRRWRKNEEIMSWIWTVNLAGLAAAMVLSLSETYRQDAGAFWWFYAPLTLTASRPGLAIRRRLSGETAFTRSLSGLGLARRFSMPKTASLAFGA